MEDNNPRIKETAKEFVSTLSAKGFTVLEARLVFAEMRTLIGNAVPDHDQQSLSDFIPAANG